jgi:hypothetical protein
MPKVNKNINYDELANILKLKTPKFPKYVSPFINMTNTYSRATRPKGVGQLSELIKDSGAETEKKWRNWYIKKYPDKIKIATKKNYEKMKEIIANISKIKKSQINVWVEDLVITKTFIGLKIEEAILKWLAKNTGRKYKRSNPNQESRGIDGWIGNTSISVKPISFKNNKHLRDEIHADIIVFYNKKKSKIEISFNDVHGKLKIKK